MIAVLELSDSILFCFQKIALRGMFDRNLKESGGGQSLSPFWLQKYISIGSPLSKLISRGMVLPSLLLLSLSTGVGAVLVIVMLGSLVIGSPCIIE